MSEARSNRHSRSHSGSSSGARRVEQQRADAGRFAVLAVFVMAVFVLGGGARDDLQSLLLLRPAAVGFAAWALWVAAPGDLKAIRIPLALLLVLVVLIAVQLVPLPPEVWHALPGREAIARRDALVGLSDNWRPLSLSPSKSWNSLVSLIVPLAALLLLAVQPATSRLRIVEVLLIVAATSAVLGLAQILGPAGGPLYFYNITNEASAVGLFANRNHHASFLAASFPLLGWYFLFAIRSELLLSRLWVSCVVGGAGLWTLVIALSGSRSGLVLFGLAVAVVLFQFRMAQKRGRFSRQRGPLPFSPRPLSTRWARIALWAGLVAAVVAAIWVVPQLPAFQRFGAEAYAADVRFSAAPTIFAMAREAFPAGMGFGAFEHAYKAYEPDALLTSSYLNQAHNDFLQLAVEAGLPGLMLLVLALFWLGGRFRAVLPWLRRAEPDAWLALTALGSLGLLAAASTVDYPLRTPSQMVFAVLLVVFALYPPSATRPARPGNEQR